jgi:hypothetical protein
MKGVFSSSYSLVCSVEVTVEAAVVVDTGVVDS